MNLFNLQVALFALAAVAAAESDPLLYAANPLWGGIGYTGYNAGLLGYGLPWAAGVYGETLSAFLSVPQIYFFVKLFL